MSSPRTTPTSPSSPSGTGNTDVRSALLRWWSALLRWFSLLRRLLVYRVMAYLSGVLLLLLCTSMVLKYGFSRDDLAWSAAVHGWMYVVYLITVVMLGNAVRWRPSRMVLVALAGTIPLMSFVAERSVTREVRGL